MVSVTAFWNPAVDKIARAKTARTNQHLYESSNDYARHQRNYTNDATTAFQRRGDIGKARKLNSSRRQQLLTKNTGQARHYGTEETRQWIFRQIAIKLAPPQRFENA